MVNAEKRVCDKNSTLGSVLTFGNVKSIILIQVSCALLSRIYPLIVIIVITGLMGAVCGCGCARND